MRKVLSIVALCFFMLASATAQRNYILIGSDIPIQYALGYEYCPVKWVGFQGKAGILTSPYDQAILGIMQALGTDPTIVRMIDGAFQLGGIGQATINFHAKKWYYGITGEYIALSAADVPTNLVENYFGYDFSPFSNIANPLNPKVNINMRSNLLQAGVCVGRKIEITNWAEVRLEFSLGKNVWSSSKVDVSSVKGTLFGIQHSEQYLSNQISNELTDIYKKYAYTPSLNIYWTFKF